MTNPTDTRIVKEKRPKKKSPTQRSLDELRKRGYTVAITERWNPFAKIRQDIFGFIDLLCFKGNEILAVQTTSGANVSARIEKIKGIQAAALWIESPTRRLIVHGWAKQGARGERKLWTLREVEIKTEPPVSFPNLIDMYPSTQ